MTSRCRESLLRGVGGGRQAAFPPVCSLQPLQNSSDTPDWENKCLRAADTATEKSAESRNVDDGREGRGHGRGVKAGREQGQSCGQNVKHP